MFQLINKKPSTIVVNGTKIVGEGTKSVTYLDSTTKEYLQKGWVTVSPTISSSIYLENSPLDTTALTSSITPTPTVIPLPSTTLATEQAIANICVELVRLGNELANIQAFLVDRVDL